jgi:hypothetical protein
VPNGSAGGASKSAPVTAITGGVEPVTGMGGPNVGMPVGVPGSSPPVPPGSSVAVGFGVS